MIYLHLADGFEEIEAMATLDILRRAELDTMLVSVMETKQVKSVRNVVIEGDLLWKEADYDKCDMIVLPRGIPGVDNLAANKMLCKALIDFTQKEKWIAAICAAPKILYQLGLLEGKRITCFPGLEEEMEKVICLKDDVVVDGKLITSQGPATAMNFGFKIVELLLGMDKVNEIKKKMLVK